MLDIQPSNKRGAALILEIIIYLVIVSLIAVAVTSGVRATRDLVFTNHAKGDLQTLQTWMEGKYVQDGKYPPDGAFNGTYNSTGDVPAATVVGGVMNTIAFSTTNGAQSGYCIQVISQSISDSKKRKFWVLSTDPSKLIQSSTGSNGFSFDPPSTGNPGYTCTDWAY